MLRDRLLDAGNNGCYNLPCGFSAPKCRVKLRDKKKLWYARVVTRKTGDGDATPRERGLLFLKGSLNDVTTGYAQW